MYLRVDELLKCGFADQQISTRAITWSCEPCILTILKVARPLDERTKREQEVKCGRNLRDHLVLRAMHFHDFEG
jgi:hypothetical protein